MCAFWSRRNGQWDRGKREGDTTTSCWESRLSMNGAKVTTIFGATLGTAGDARGERQASQVWSQLNKFTPRDAG